MWICVGISPCAVWTLLHNSIQAIFFRSFIGLGVDSVNTPWLVVTQAFNSACILQVMAYLHCRIRTQIETGIRIPNLHCIKQKFSQSTELDSDSNSNCQLQEWDQNQVRLPQCKWAITRVKGLEPTVARNFLYLVNTDAVTTIIRVFNDVGTGNHCTIQRFVILAWN